MIQLSATDVPAAARLNRAFLGRAARYVASHGVTQFLDIGAGLPIQQSVHQVAQVIAQASEPSTSTTTRSSRDVQTNYGVEDASHGGLYQLDGQSSAPDGKKHPGLVPATLTFAHVPDNTTSGFLMPTPQQMLDQPPEWRLVSS